VSAGQGRVKTVDQLRKTVERNNYMGLLEEMVRRFFPMSKAHFLRSNSKAAVLQTYLAKRAEIMAKKKSERTVQEIEFSTAKYKEKYIAERCLESRDIVYENALIMLQQILVYKDFHDAMRGGHSGRMEKDLEIAMVMFAGCGKSNYAKEMMEQQIDRLRVWTPEHAYLDLNNCVVNPSGKPRKWVARDEFNEEINLLASDTMNPRNTWQLRRYHQETLPRCMMLLKDAKHIVPMQAGANMLGSHHGRVDDTEDIIRMANLLVEDEVFVNKPGRSFSGLGITKVGVVPSVDTFQEGAKEIIGGKMLTEILKRRQMKNFPDAPDVDSGDESFDCNHEEVEQNMENGRGTAGVKDGGGQNRK
jgi:hypothetical protein